MSYIGPLTGITKDVADRGFDPVAYTRDLYAAAPRADVRTCVPFLARHLSR